MADQRRFSEQEAAAIMRRAAQLQTKQPQSQGGPVSLEDLKAIAEEAGIDPAILRQAMAETEGGQQAKSRDVVRVIDGELDPSEFDVVNDAVGPSRMGVMSTQVGRTMQRQVGTGAGYGMLSVTSRDGTTKISLKRNYVGAFMAGAYPFILMGFILGVNLMAHRQFLWGSLALSVLPFLGLLLFLFLRQLYDRKCEELVGRVAESLSYHLEKKQPVRSNLATASPKVEEDAETQIQGL